MYAAIIANCLTGATLKLIFKGISMRFFSRLMVFVFFLIAFSFVVRALLPYASWKMVDNAFSYVSFPLMKVQAFISEPLYKLAHRKWDIEALQKKVDQLYQEKEQVIARNIELEAALRFGNQAGALCEFKKRYQHANALLGQVIMRTCTESEHLIFVDRGAHHGVTAGMVAVYENNLIGRVSEVFPFYSKILLITDARCKVAAWCGAQQARGIHEGQQQVHTVLNHVSHLEHVTVGDMVISSGEGTIFPYGLALGVVTFCANDGIYHAVRVKPLIDPMSVTYCLLVQKTAHDHL